ncbi:cobalamin biosynthesis protein [Chelativorans alearense]|uniref:cobalamin biosynthesis protein n=1 Tax=Chelativorans alearense TaxID=2681495 RepID=UPI0013D47D97|nr:cobalamin biosynthesis protein [Chelativorans alearense]
MRVAGIGCRTGVAAGEVLAAVEACSASFLQGWCGEADTPRLDALATAAFKVDEAGIVAAAKALSIPLIAVPRDDLKRASAGCLTRSDASLAATGVASVSEAAALAAAGKGSRLLGPRIATGNVTCAIAQSKDQV